jgi:protein gp37
MSDGTAIQWTDASWNPVTGCTKVSPGCAHCYIVTTPAFRIAGRKFVNGATDIRFHEARLGQPLYWRRPRRIFVNSLSDLFHEAIPDAFIARVYGVMVAAYWHEFQVLTKRPARRLALLRDERFRELVAQEAARLIKTYRGEQVITAGRATRLREMGENLASWYEGSARNIWEGVTAENQRWADKRIPELLATPAAVRFVSYEPALGPVDFDHIDCTCDSDPGFSALTWTEDDEGTLGDAVLDWVIVGGESGPKARPFDLEWARSVVRQCQAAGVAAFVKQLGAKPLGCCAPDMEEFPGECDAWSSGEAGRCRGRCAYLHDRKGGDMLEWPADLRVREFPEVRPCDTIKVLDEMEAERKAVCDEYGLPDSYPILRQHIEANRALVSAFDKQTMRGMAARIDAAEQHAID